MTAPRDQVTCRQCGAVLGRFVGGTSDRLPRLDLLPNVVLLVTLGRVDAFCPLCSHVRRIELTRYQVTRGKAA